MTAGNVTGLAEAAMFSAEEFLTGLRNRGCRVETDGTDLLVTPARLLTEADKGTLRERKSDVLQTLLPKRQERPKRQNVMSRTEEVAFEQTIRETLAAEWGCRPAEVRVWSPKR